MEVKQGYSALLSREVFGKLIFFYYNQPTVVMLKLVEGSTLRLPESHLPKPGENVVWYSGNAPKKGKLIGYEVGEKPRIKTEFGNETTVDSFKQIRLLDPYSRISPNWCSMPPDGKIYGATQALKKSFSNILEKRIPPGPSYLELINEIHARGFEIFIVGGTVRDTLQGNDAHDVDLVTTMPLLSYLPLLKSMFGKISPNPKFGYVRIGGNPSSGEPFIDIKNFPLYNPGSDDALFGSDLGIDFRYRDFACNSIYYEPINECLIDPSGRGVIDALNKELFVVKDLSKSSPIFHQATLFIRFIKFLCRGYAYSDETLSKIKEEFVPLISTMKRSRKSNYIKAQILNKYPKEQHIPRLNEFIEKIKEIGLESIYTLYFEDLTEIVH